MSNAQRKLSFQNKVLANIIYGLSFSIGECGAQIINYINNPSFELATPSTSILPDEGALFWGAIDTLNCGSHLLRAKFLNSVPIGFGGYQLPKTGNNFIGTTFYCDSFTCQNVRWYPRNRLKQTLQPNVEYCAKYHVVNTNNSPVGIKEFAALFCGGWLDTTSVCNYALTYLNPQIVYQGTFITDTLNWIPITGTFVADGSEKYMVLGNFKSNAATSTIVINPTYLPGHVADILIDDVSLIEMDLPAFAGIDTAIVPGDSAFIGRTPDVGIDEACRWFKLPNMTTAIDTVAGMWTKPVVTTTYVVRQQLWCSGVKWDTVVIYMNPVGLTKQFDSKKFNISPVPAQDELTLEIISSSKIPNEISIQITNQFNQLISQELIREEKTQLRIENLPDGIYYLQVTHSSGEKLHKRFVVAR